ncbi:hypothetical protein bsdtb5_38760 [Anaeromicropila herbilytica]|uniref:Uncharacterized protein n=1 Tax=Anaeromicropila herbilytica TaxID=2785025 RepID=A0A7R7EPU2_9FIRM|nr:hypothetical protein bsdtb5_38760 [Anaeromicropila herbilytica]
MYVLQSIESTYNFIFLILHISLLQSTKFSSTSPVKHYEKSQKMSNPKIGMTQTIDTNYLSSYDKLE